MTAARNTERLLRFADAARAAGVADADWFADAVRDWSRREVTDLETPLGLRPGRGERDGRSTLALSTRDAIMRDARSRFLPNASTRDAARELARALASYRGGDWQRERSLDACPMRHRGKLRALLWAILKASDTAPRERTIRLALAAKGGDFAASESGQRSGNEE